MCIYSALSPYLHEMDVFIDAMFVFSDKTGTLTQNIMTFNKCSINGRCYGDIIDDKTGEPVDVDEVGFLR